MKNKKQTFIAFVLLIIAFVAISGAVYISQLKRTGIYPYRVDKDLPFVEKLFAENWYWLIPEGMSFDVKDTFTKLLPPPYEFQSKSDALVYIYWQNNKPAGLIVYYMKNFYQGKIWFLVVQEEYRKQGISTKLLQYALKDLKSRGASTIWLLTRTDNVRAQSIYKRAGFQEKPYYDNRFVVFEKNLI